VYSHATPKNATAFPMNKLLGPPQKQGLYDPRFEHDACGVGFVVHINGQKSHDIVEQAFTILVNLDHRGACGCEPNTGDGAGILMQLPDRFLSKVAPESAITLPPQGEYAVGKCFLSPDADTRAKAQELFV